MKCRLIPLRVHTYQTGHIRELSLKMKLIHNPSGGEQLVQFGDELFAPAHQVDQTLNVVLHMPGVCPRIAFSKIPFSGKTCLLYTSDAADEEDSVDLGDR